MGKVYQEQDLHSAKGCIIIVYVVLHVSLKWKSYLCRQYYLSDTRFYADFIKLSRPTNPSICRMDIYFARERRMFYY
jgi:hypothetical protein